MSFIQAWHCQNCSYDYVLEDLLPEYLFSTNEPLLAEELLDLKDTLSTTSTDLMWDIATVNMQLASLDEKRQVLCSRLAEMELRLSTYKSISSPLRRFPSEIITEIISWATATDDVTLDTRYGIWAFSRVCQRWREVALSTSSFWSRIFIDIDRRFTSEHKVNRLQECVNTILSRTGNHALSLRFAYDPENGYARDAADSSIHLFVEHAPQWREVSFTIPGESFAFLRSVEGRISILQKLDLHFHSNLDGECVEGRYFSYAPSLQKVSFCSDLVYPELIPLPWSQITEYKASGIKGDALESLKLMPNLIFLTLEFPQKKEKLRPELKLKKLRKLKVLKGAHVVAVLTLPDLDELTICLSSSELTAMIHLVERSDCHIVTLTIEEHWEEGTPDLDILTAFLHVLPEVLVLDLSREETENIFNLLWLMVTAPEDHCLLPKLAELILPPIDDCVASDLHDIIIRLAHRRIPETLCAITNVVFVGEPQPLPVELSSLQRDGLRVSFT